MGLGRSFNTTRLLSLLVLVALPLIATVSLLQIHGEEGPPTLVTDKTGYLAGETVQISGTGFQAGEVIALSVTHADGAAETGMNHEASYNTTADSYGAFAASWSLTLDPWDTGTNNFVVLAAGASSTVSATATINRIATVQTDKYDYAPNSTALISGAGFRPGSEVTIRVEHSNGRNEGNGHLPFNTFADVDGKISANWHVDPDDSEGSIFRLTAEGSGLIATTTLTDALETFIDDAGPDDEPGQKDLNYMQVDDDGLPVSVAVVWGWDDTGWPGNNTGDACALFDTNADGFANFAQCVTVHDTPATFLSKRLYSCNDLKADRCSGPTLIPNTATATASVVAGADPFGTSGRSTNDCDVNANCLTADTVANVTVQVADFGTVSSVRLTNVCTYPSQEPNSDPSDCVVRPNAGLLTIIKELGNVSTLTNKSFTFNSSVPSAECPSGPASCLSSWTINPAPGAVNNISFGIPGSGTSTTINLAEVSPFGWQLDSVVCEIQTSTPTGTGSATASGINTVEIRSGLETICTFRNSENEQATHAHLTLLKTVIKDNGGNAADTAFTLTATGPTANVTGVEGDSQITDRLVQTGTYTLSETNLPGYTPGAAWSCSGGTFTSPDKIALAAGESATCTITNDDIQPTLKVTKVVNNQFGTTLQVSDFTLKIDATTVTSGVANNKDVGTYIVSETAKTGWTGVISGDCDAVTGSVTLAPGDTKACTITNTPTQPTLKVTKVVNNQFGTTLQVSDFTLKIDATTVTSGVANNKNVGTYIVSETAKTGWTGVISGDCDAVTGSVTLAPGDTKACTITNTPTQPTLKVTKVVNNQFGTTLQVSDFTLKIDATTVTSGVANNKDVGTYIVSETAKTGWTGVISGDCDAVTGSVTLAPGDTKACTITNTPTQPTLKVTKVVNNQFGTTLQVSDFTLKIDATTVTSGVANNKDVGTYIVSETAKTGWTGVISGDCDAVTGSVTLAPGDTKACTITNTPTQPTLKVTKVVNNQFGTTLQVSDFTLKIDATTVTSGVANNKNVGTYIVSETAKTGWTGVISGDCDAVTGSVTLAPGDTKACTITNTPTQPTLKVTKVVNNQFGTTLQVSDFTLKIDATTVTSGVANNKNVGTYIVSETAKTGWTGVISGDCDAVTGSVTLAPGDTKACTITNTPTQPTLKVTKVVNNQFGTTLQVSDFTLKIDATTVTSGVANNKDVGTYIVSETAKTGWTGVISGDCDAVTGSVTLAPGDTKACTITNTPTQPTLKVTKVVNNQFGTTLQVSDFTLKIDATTVTSGVANNKDVGTYIVSETAKTGWTGVISGDCDAVTGSVTLAPGDTKACTITNTPTQPTLKVTKVVNNQFGTTLQVSDFTLKIDATTVTSGVANNKNVGTYIVSETAKTGWTGVISGDCDAVTGSVTLAPGDTKACTITNTPTQPTLKVTKVVNNQFGTTLQVSDFTLKIDATTVTSGVANNKNVGTYIVSETAKTGWTGVISGDCDAVTGSVTLAPGDTKACTITNTPTQPKLTLTKTVIVDNGGTKQVSDFVLKIGTTTVTSGVANFLNVGGYTASEVNLPGYQASPWGGDCAPSGYVTLAPGDNKTCTITNNDLPGTIIVKKVIKPTGALTSFNFQTTGDGGANALPDYQAFSLADGGQNSQNLDAGSYTVKELVPLGWTLTGIGGSTDVSTPYNCTVTGSGGSTGVGDLNTQTATIALKNGDTVTCVFENTGEGATRTQGFWATHSQLASIAWFGGTNFGHTFPGVAAVAGIGNTTVCKDIDILGKLMSGFWSDVSKTSTNKKRTPLDQARMQLLQQLLATELNASAFGSVPNGGTGKFAAWETALCGTSQSAIATAMQEAASFNSQGDSSTFTPGTSADSKTGRALAVVPPAGAFWDSF